MLADFIQPYNAIGQAFINFWWIILPVAFYYIFKIIWMDFVIEKSKFSFVSNWEWTLLEIITPDDIEKSPKMIESLYVGIAGIHVNFNTFDTFLKGAVLDKFSLEIVGEEGNVHFYIRTQKKWRNLIEAQIYAQLPSAEVFEVEDYVNKFPKVVPNKDWDLWGSDIELVMPDAYPIKTYDKFVEDVTGKMIDPLASIVEVIGTLTPGQNLWLQLVIEPLPEVWRKDEMKVVQKLTGRLKEDKNSIIQDLIDIIKNIFAGIVGPVTFGGAANGEAAQWLDMKLTPIEREVLRAVEDNLGKNAYKTKMRMIYVGKRENFDKTYVSAFFGALKQFNDLNLNNFKPNDASKTYANYIFKEERLAHRQRKIYHRYKTRSMDDMKIVLSTSELATIFHFPDMAVQSPTLLRVASKKGTAPFNLPIQ